MHGMASKDITRAASVYGLWLVCFWILVDLTLQTSGVAYPANQRGWKAPTAKHYVIQVIPRKAVGKNIFSQYTHTHTHKH